VVCDIHFSAFRQFRPPGSEFNPAHTQFFFSSHLSFFKLAQAISAFNTIIKVTNNHVYAYLAQLWNLGQSCCCTGHKYGKMVRNIYILYNSGCFIHLKPLKIQLNYWNYPNFNFHVHRPPSALKLEELSFQLTHQRNKLLEKGGIAYKVL
jgi:hypothetical protein